VAENPENFEILPQPIFLINLFLLTTNANKNDFVRLFHAEQAVEFVLNLVPTFTIFANFYLKLFCFLLGGRNSSELRTRQMWRHLLKMCTVFAGSQN
jgi:hypothetical protein